MGLSWPLVGGVPVLPTNPDPIGEVIVEIPDELVDPIATVIELRIS
jgi:hypothetical protein